MHIHLEYVAPLGSTSLIFNFLFARFMVGTPVTRTDIYVGHRSVRLHVADHLLGYNNRSSRCHWHCRIRWHQQWSLFRDQRRPSHCPLEEGWMARLLLLHVYCFACRPQVHFLPRRRPHFPFRYYLATLHRHERTQITLA